MLNRLSISLFSFFFFSRILILPESIEWLREHKFAVFIFAHICIFDLCLLCSQFVDAAAAVLLSAVFFFFFQFFLMLFRVHFHFHSKNYFYAMFLHFAHFHCAPCVVQNFREIAKIKQQHEINKKKNFYTKSPPT